MNYKCFGTRTEDPTLYISEMQLKYGELRSCCDHVGHHAGTNIIVLLIWKLTKFKALVAVGDQSTIKSLICIRKSRLFDHCYILHYISKVNMTSYSFYPCSTVYQRYRTSQTKSLHVAGSQQSNQRDCIYHFQSLFLYIRKHDITKSEV